MYSIKDLAASAHMLHRHLFNVDRLLKGNRHQLGSALDDAMGDYTALPHSTVS